ncbi:MAG TPA: hypothetical protein VIK64_18520 [Anaerolineales bacterium]|jgi:hypothetical protein
MDENETRKVYVKPEIIHEMELETKAGSPAGSEDPFDLLGFEQ